MRYKGGGGGRGGGAPGGTTKWLVTGLYFLYCGGHKAASGRWPGEIVVDVEACKQEIAHHAGRDYETNQIYSEEELPFPVGARLVLHGQYSESLHRSHGVRHIVTGSTTNQIIMHEDGRFDGIGWDDDGCFVLEEGLYNPRNGKIGWYEKGKRLHTVVTGRLVEIGTCNVKVDARYHCKNTQHQGTLEMQFSSETEHTKDHSVPEVRVLTPTKPRYNPMLDANPIDRAQVIAFFPVHFVWGLYHNYRVSQKEETMAALDVSSKGS